MKKNIKKVLLSLPAKYNKAVMDNLLENMIPQDIYLHFEMVSLTEYPDRFEMKLEEDAALVPADMSGNVSI